MGVPRKGGGWSSFSLVTRKNPLASEERKLPSAPFEARSRGGEKKRPQSVKGKKKKRNHLSNRKTKGKSSPAIFHPGPCQIVPAKKATLGTDRGGRLW